MKRLSIAAALALLLTNLPTVNAQGTTAASGEALTLAQEITEKGATLFNTANATAMADTYLPDAKIFFVSNEETGITVKEYAGREEILKAYSDLFKNSATLQSKNTVEFAKLVTPELLMIAGTFEPNQLQADGPKVPFYQVRVKQGDAWKIQSMRIFVILKK
jgi:hypothetical protein